MREPARWPTRPIPRRVLLSGLGGAGLGAAGLGVAGLGVAGTAVGCAPARTEPGAPRSVALLATARRRPVSQEIADGFRAGVSGVPGTAAVVTGPDVADGPLEVHQLEELLHSSPAGISIFTLSADLLVEPVAAAEAAGVPLIALDNPPPDGSRLGLFVGNDSFELGRMLAQLVAAQVAGRPAGGGTVVLGSPVPGIPVLDLRAEGLRAELERQLPGVSVRGPFDTTADAAANRAAWGVLAEAYPDAVAFVGTADADSDTLGALHRERRAGWVAGGFDLTPAALDAVRTGDLVLVSPEHYLKGAVAGRLLAVNAATGGTLPTGWVLTPGLAVNRDNAEEISRRQASDGARRAALLDQVDGLLADLPAHLHPTARIRHR